MGTAEPNLIAGTGPSGINNRVRRLIRSALYRRLALGVGANAYSQLVTVALMLGALPVLLHAWGAAKYGLWLVLSAVPSYLSMGDLGFGTAAANDMTMSTARGDVVAARRVHQSILALNWAVLAFLCAGAFAACFLVPASWFASAMPTEFGEIRATVLLLSLSTLASLAWNPLSAALWAERRYALSVTYNDSVRLLDGLSVLVAAACGGSLMHAAAASLAIRTIGLLCGFVLVRTKVRWVRLGFTDASWSELTRLAGPAFGVMALPIGFAISLQLTTLVVGSQLGLASVALFSALRSASRVAVQGVGVVTHAVVPEVSHAYGRHDQAAVHRLVRMNLGWAVAAAVAFFATAALLGPTFIEAWSRGRLRADGVVVDVFAISAAIQAIWNSGSNMLLAVNRQARYSFWFIATSTAAALGSFVFARHFGLTGVGGAVALADAIMLVIVFAHLRGVFFCAPPHVHRESSGRVD